MAILIVTGQELHVDDMKNTSVYCLSFGSSMFSWCSRKQDVVDQSTTETEYVAATTIVNQGIWIRKILADLHMDQLEPTQIYVDNQAAISIANNHVFHSRTKHFKIKLYFFKRSSERKRSYSTLLQN
jgi:hypothetical protein